MASRRIRIKDIANIPQRRKTAVGAVQEKQKEEVAKSDDKANEVILSEHPETNAEQKQEVKIESVKFETERTDENKNEGINGEVSVIEEEEIARKADKITAVIDIKKEISSVKATLGTIKQKIETAVESKYNLTSNVLAEKQLQQSENLTAEQREKVANVLKTEAVTSQPNLNSKSLTAATSDGCPRPLKNRPIFRANFIKPIISNSVLQRRNRLKVEDETRTSESEGESSVGNKKETDEKNAAVDIQLPVKESGDININYPPAPPSPSKINRGRIKVVPRFGQRRQSFSASESEDDNRKSNRIRNDSVCSTASEMVEQSNPLEYPHSPKKDVANVIQRKFRRTEQSRKLAEARREFLQKFGSSKPDRQKLTMMDLIFYNPSSNPMSQKQMKEKIVEETVTEVVEDAEKDQPEEIVLSDEENEELAPQVKVGPNGEITIDEKSLVVENKQVKRSQEKLQNSKLVDGDSVTTYGIYKKAKRTKLWSKKETLRFYKALNAIGSDFSLMLSLFPGRTRRDLTMKFKKEEKINRPLIDRALMVPNTYDIEELKKEMEREEREERAKEKVKQEVELLAKKKAEEKRKKREEKSAEKKQALPPRKRCSTARKLHTDLNKGINSFLEDESDADDESDASSKQVSAIVLDTVQSNLKKKSLRPRKIRKIYTDPEESDEDDLERQQLIVTARRVEEKQEESVPEEEKPPELEKEVEKNPNMEPGSVLMYSMTGDDGSPVYKFFMVTPAQGEKTDVQNKFMNIGTLRVHESASVPTEENNVTISAAEEGAKDTPHLIIQQNIVIKPGAQCPSETETANNVAQTDEQTLKNEIA